MALSTSQVQSAYVTFFNRPADPVGLNFWLTNGSSLPELLASFAASAEYTAQYAGKSPAQIVNTIYNNLFGRDAEANGLLFWSNALTAGTVTVATIANEMSTNGAQGADAVAFANKTAAAVAFTAAVDTSAEILGYAGAASLAAARAYIASVTDDASLAKAIAPAALAAAVSGVTALGQSPADVAAAAAAAASTSAHTAAVAAEATAKTAADAAAAALAASTAANTKAGLTDAAALKLVSDASTAAAQSAVAANTSAKSAAAAALVAFNAAVNATPPVAADVNTANANLLIADAKVVTSAALVASTATKAAADLTATTAAQADDAAAATATAALTAAVATGVTATAAATTAAAADVAAAAAFKTAAAATVVATDDAAAAAAVAAATATATAAAADATVVSAAKVAADAAAAAAAAALQAANEAKADTALVVYNSATIAADAALAAAATANADYDTAAAAVTTKSAAQAAVALAAASTTAAATAKTAVDAQSAAAAALAAATAATTRPTDDSAAAAAVNAAKAAATAATAAIAGASTDATAANGLLATYSALKFTADVASVNEGSAITFTLVNGAANTTYGVKISGVQAADVTGSLANFVTTDANGGATLTVGIAADRLTEGAETITATIVGATGNGSTASATVNDTSLNNTAPAITAAATLAATEDTAATFTASAVDAEADAVTVVATAANGTVVNNGAGSFSYTGKADFNGADTITVTATDALGAATTQTIAVTVAAVNDAPVVTVPATLAANEETAATFAVVASDVDGDTLTVTATAANGAVVKNVDGSYSYTGKLDFAGTDTITVTANDGTVDTVKTIAVTVANVNDAPVATAATAAATEAGAAVTGALVATDVDAGDVLTYKVDAEVVGLTLNANGTYSFDPVANPAAQALVYSSANLVLPVAYTVTDVAGATSKSTLTITVTPKPLTFALTADKASAEEGATTVYTLTASEALTTAKDVTFTLVPGNGTASSTGTSTTNTADFATGAFNPTTVTIAAGAKTATFNVVAVNDAATELQEGYSVDAAVAGFTTLTLAGKVVDATAAGGVGQTFTLTTGSDTMPGLIGSANSTGTDGNDTINATGKTFTALDDLNAGLGNDKIIIKDADGVMNSTVPNGIKLTSVESMEIQTAGSLGVAGVQGRSAEAAVKQVDTVTFGIGNDPIAQGDVITVDYGGVTVDTAPLGATPTKNQAMTLIAGVINGIAGTTVATVAGDALVLTAPVAGVDLPNYTITDDNGDNLSVATPIPGQEAVVAVTAVTAVPYNVSSFTDTTTVSVTGSDGMALKAASNQDVIVSGSTGTITVHGGKSVSVTDATADKDIVIGATGSYAVSSITVTDTKQGTGDITIDGGSDVTVTANVTGAEGGNIIIGNNKEATGAVVVTVNLTSDGDTFANNGKISVDGGDTVNVTVNATSTAADSDSDEDIDVGNVYVTGDGTTTAVTVKVNESVTTVTKAAVAFVGATQTLKFAALDAGDTTIIEGLTFKASQDLSAEQVAAAFAGLTASDKQDNGGPTANGFYSGSFAADWTSAAASGDTVVFTSTIIAADPEALDVDNGDVDPTTSVAYKVGKDAVPADKSGNDVIFGDVTINDDADASITTITLDGFNSAFLGGSGALNALTTLSLTDGDGTTELNSTATTLNVTLNDMSGTISDVGNAGSGSITTMNLTTTGVKTTASLNALAMTTLNITANVGLIITDPTSGIPEDLANVTITGAGTVNLGTFTPIVKLDSFDASGNTGGITTTIETTDATLTGDIEEYVFSQGADNVTLANANVDVAVTLGAGNDKINLASLTTVLVGVIDGGDDTDTLVMAAADADDASLSALFEAKITGFEKIDVKRAVGDDVVRMNNLDDINYVITNGTDVVDDDTLTIEKLASNGTVELKADGDITVNVTDADTNNAAVLNIIAQTNGNTYSGDGLVGIADLGDITANEVETIKLTVNDSTFNDDGDTVSNEKYDVDVGVLALHADTAKTVTVGGNTSVTLDLSGAVKATLVDASLLAAGLTLVADGATAGTEVRGGTGKDTLTSDGENDVLKGNDGADTFNVTNLAKVYGGAGADVFNFSAALNLAKVSTVMDGVATGDTFKLFFDGSAENEVTAFYAEGADYNATVANSVVLRVEASLGQTADGEATWFNFGGNTYIVIDGTDSTAATTDTYVDTYEAGVDTVIEIIGEFNLGTGASFNKTFGTLEII